MDQNTLHHVPLRKAITKSTTFLCQVYWLPHDCACTGLNARFYENDPAVASSRSNPWYRKSCCRSGATDLPNHIIWGSYMKRTKLIKHVTKDHARERGALEKLVEGRVEKIHDSLSHQISTIGGPKLLPLRLWGGEWGQGRMLPIWETWKTRINGNLATRWWLETGTSLHSLEKSTNWSRKPNHRSRGQSCSVVQSLPIPSAIRPERRTSVVVVRLNWWIVVRRVRMGVSQLRWFGHVSRMSRERLAGQVRKLRPREKGPGAEEMGWLLQKSYLRPGLIPSFCEASATIRDCWKSYRKVIQDFLWLLLPRHFPEEKRVWKWIKWMNCFSLILKAVKEIP